jgi:putative resolvase
MEKTILKLPQVIKIGEAASMLGVTPWTLRKWDTEGILKPTFKSKKTRYYSLERLQKLSRWGI